jgi:isochorismate synthase
MLAPLDTLSHLKARLGEHATAVASAGDQGFVSLVLELPETPVTLPQIAGSQFQLLHSHREELRAGYGVAGEWHASGPDRLSELRRQAFALSDSWQHLDPDETGFKGFALLGLAARATDPAQVPTSKLPNALLWLPEAALHVKRGQAAVVLTSGLPTTRERIIGRWDRLLDQLIPRTSEPAPGPLRPARLKRCLETPDADAWRGLLRAALGQIAAGDIQKVVLARRLRIESSRQLDLGRLVTALTFFFPSCQVVNIRRADARFVAATPERLFSLRGNRVEADALAGTASRAVESKRDGALAEALRRSSKNLHEHRLVVQDICAALGSYTSRIEAPAEPDVMRLNNAQHLWSRISASLDTRTDVFALAESLHPTPATNGTPRGRASAWLRQSDPFDRGWYTGVSGTVEPDLTGELWVLLRCAEIRDRAADLYAGAGIVAGSDPMMEWRETEHKLAAMLTALQFA